MELHIQFSQIKTKYMSKRRGNFKRNLHKLELIFTCWTQRYRSKRRALKDIFTNWNKMIWEDEGDRWIFCQIKVGGMGKILDNFTIIWRNFFTIFSLAGEKIDFCDRIFTYDEGNYKWDFHKLKPIFLYWNQNSE